MGCSEGLARIFVFVTNFAFLLVGLALLVVGILYKVNYTKYTEAIPDDLSSIQYVPTIAIVVGAVIFFIAFLGCCGTLKSNTCMLTWYGAILIVIFLVQVGLGVFALLQVKNETELQAQVENQLTTIFGKNDTELINLIQLNFQCCGTNGPSSWAPASIPKSCYSTVDGTLFQNGCVDSLSNFLTSSVKIIGIVAIAVSAVELIGATLALCLTSCIRDKRRLGSYY
ncbi:23 kDa integral membrane protein [Dendroctonus ponderosae]|uniref:Tetraspanin n=1 Tax=Dendroctonus ponderosae TaxID=77166 RepID=J3JTH0_DENPD|nr:23 kDa integral membrane protein [Dendroctonus ponderosae]AEE61490.1 unknown [Dendroctonus ponderosae]ERL86529.1 hypothetical protein D910_03935 [Dendroctonus ponderosae]